MIEHIKLDASPNKDLFAFPYGIDDFMVFASALKKYKDENSGRQIHLLVLSPQQPAFNSNSYVKELATEYPFIDAVYEMENIVITKDNRLVVDKKRIDKYLKMYCNYVKYDRVKLIEFDPFIKMDDYRYNVYFQCCTLLGIRHSKPEYMLPNTSHKAPSAKRWLADNGIAVGDRYAVVQLKSRFENKSINLKLYDKVVAQMNLGGLKYVEMNSKILPKSINMRPEEVSNLTTIEIVKGAELVISNVSYAFQIGGFLNKKTIAIVNPQTPSLIRDFCFNFSQKNIVFLALDGTIMEWGKMREEVPFLHGNEAFENEVEVRLGEVNFYNPKQQKNKLTRLILAQKEKFKEMLKNNEKIDEPLVWYHVDEKSLKYGGYDPRKDHGIKYQALSGLPQLLAYEDLDYDKIKVKLTNIYRPFA